MRNNNRKSAAEAAYDYISPRMRTRSEVIHHLKEKGYEEGEVLDAVNELTSMNYLDDYQYALRYYEYNREKRRGSERAARELAEKGIDPETVKNAREDYLYHEHVDEYADARAVAMKELELKTDGPGVTAGDAAASDIDGERAEKQLVIDEKLLARIARKLDGRGFSRGDIFKVLDEIRRLYGS